MDPEDTKYARLFGRDREDACVTLALSIDEEKTTHEKKFELRSLMLKWSEMKKPRPAPDSLGNLPIFQTKDKSLKRLTTTFAPPSVEPYDVTSRWEEVLGLDNYRNLFLDYSEDLQRLLKLANHPRMDQVRFIGDFIFPRIQELDQTATVYLLTCLADINLASVFHGKDLTNIHCVVDGENRYCCSHYLDPSDLKLQQIFQGNDFLFPPECYQTPQVLKAMRKCGLLSLRQEEGFYKAAKAVETSQSIPGANSLITYLLDLHTHEKLAWPRPFYDKLAKVAFVPCIDIQDLAFPPVEMVQGKLPICIKIQKPTKNQEKSKRKPGTRQEQVIIHDDSSDEGDIITVKEQYSTAGSMLSNWIHETTKTHQPLTIVLCSFDSPQVVFHSSMLQNWTRKLILPQQFDKTSNALMCALNFQTKFGDALSVSQHLQRMAQTWCCEPPASETILRARQAVILLCFTSLHGFYTLMPKCKTVIQKHLCGIPIVLLDNGEYVACHTMVFSLENDISTSARAVPGYLGQFNDLMSIIGAQGIQVSQQPRYTVTSENPIQEAYFATQAHRLFETGQFSDVSISCIGREGEKVIRKAHKFILAPLSPVFERMFLSGFQETEQNATIDFLTVNDVAVDLLLHFLYTGVITSKLTKLDPPNQESVVGVLGLLELSDRLMIPYLKEWSEVYLSHGAVVDLHNIVDLFFVAHQFGGFRLKKLCLFHISRMFDVIIQMKEWQELDTALQDEILVEKEYLLHRSQEARNLKTQVNSGNH